MTASTLCSKESAMSALDELSIDLNDLQECLNLLQEDLGNSSDMGSESNGGSLEQAQLRLALLSLTHTLYQGYMILTSSQTSGSTGSNNAMSGDIDGIPEDHPIHKELQRIQVYREKLSRLIRPSNNHSKKD
jgi:hypothetical protein